jgi:RNA-directed DNA polymerase
MRADLLTQSQTRWGSWPPPLMPASAVISVLARSLLAGEQFVDDVHARAVRTLGRTSGRTWAWLRPLARRYVRAFAAGTRPRHRDVVQFLLNDQGFIRARSKYRHEIFIAEWLAEPQRMQPVARARHWELPVIESVGDLAAWLSLGPAELEWFADLKGLGYKLRRPKLQHYHYRILLKRSGGVRLIESPKPRLKELQRRVLSEILDRVPAHSAVHGFVKRRSIVTFAAPHVSKRVLLRLDLENFFPAFPGARVQAFFRTLGYPEKVADLLGGLCANSVPREVWSVRPAEMDPMQWQEARILVQAPAPASRRANVAGGREPYGVSLGLPPAWVG